MRIVYFTHSLTSCWNHGNAHFLRGVLRELIRAGHDVAAYEPADAWSKANLLADHGEAGLRPFRDAYPELSSTAFEPGFDLDAALAGADLVIVHEWNDPALVKAVGLVRRRGGRFTLLFHDTHHRAVSDPDAIRAFDLCDYDGVLAFGEALAQVYRRWGWGRRAFVWHEAADTSLFRPPQQEGPGDGVVWIGNWGDGERTAELETFLLAPARDADLVLDVHGVRYPRAAKALLASYGAAYRGWLPNPCAPAVFARHMMTVHVPRRFYVEALPGIPTIRVFEALACGVALLSAPWSDAEGLFRPGRDFLTGRDQCEMTRRMRDLSEDAEMRAALARSGLETVRARHTCAHRASELTAIATKLEASKAEVTP
jgi:spore maturation protein CgeB